MRYFVPLEENVVDGETFTHLDLVVISGKPKRRAKLFRQYLRQKWGIWRYETQTLLIREMGFTELL